jgi:hypothetical protein
MIRKIIGLLMLAMVVLAVTVSIADILSRHQTEPLVDRRLQPTVDEWRLDMHRAGISYEKGYNRLILSESEQEMGYTAVDLIGGLVKYRFSYLN